jgi:hypothetical protein
MKIVDLNFMLCTNSHKNNQFWQEIDRFHLSSVWNSSEIHINIP